MEKKKIITIITAAIALIIIIIGAIGFYNTTQKAIDPKSYSTMDIYSTNYKQPSLNNHTRIEYYMMKPDKQAINTLIHASKSNKSTIFNIYDLTRKVNSGIKKRMGLKASYIRVISKDNKLLYSKDRPDQKNIDKAITVANKG